MKTPFLSPLKTMLALATTVVVFGMASLFAQDGKKDDAPLSIQVHPQVFSMILGWNSDSVSPVATEISLDAVEKNGNQFSKDEIKQEDEWTVCRQADVNGFKRFRVMEKKAHQYKVEYQENGGGTLTTSCIIEFSVVTREMKINGKSADLRVLRVDAFTLK